MKTADYRSLFGPNWRRYKQIQWVVYLRLLRTSHRHYHTRPPLFELDKLFDWLWTCLKLWTTTSSIPKKPWYYDRITRSTVYKPR
jgi:hypothetical protein